MKRIVTLILTLCILLICGCRPEPGIVTPVTETTKGEPVTETPETETETETSEPITETPTEPVTEPPVTEPPVTEPPVTEPPVTEPPVTEPPVTEPPIETGRVFYTAEQIEAVQKARLTDGYKVDTVQKLLSHMYCYVSVTTLYVNGAWGVPLNDYNKNRWIQGHEYNQRASRKALILAAEGTWGADCCGIVKGCIWGACALWDDPRIQGHAEYGGADYGTNGMPDTTIYNMLHKYCYDVSFDDWEDIAPGELLVYGEDYGHAGLYVGDGWVIESTSQWEDGVQYTRLWNLTGKRTGHGRYWYAHGKLKMIDYSSVCNDD